jgi:hypothetical protein
MNYTLTRVGLQSRVFFLPLCSAPGTTLALSAHPALPGIVLAG